MLSLMIGFTEQDNYQPYMNVDREREILNLVVAEKYADAVIKCENLLNTNPLNYTALLEIGFSLWKLDGDYQLQKSKYFKVLDAITYSGDGSRNQPFFVLSPIDGQTLIRYVWKGSLGTMGSGSDENGNFLDILEMKKDGESFTIYFNIQHAVEKSMYKKEIDKAVKELESE